MSDPRQAHAQFDELAAGYALHSLDPQDEHRFRGHAEQCPRCQQSLAGYGEVAAALAEAAPQAEPGRQLGERIVAAAMADQARAAAPPPEVAGSGHRKPARRLWLAAAAAAVLIAGGGTWAGLSARSAGPQPPPPGCAASQQCHEVPLTDAAVRGAAGKVIVTADSAWLIPSGLPADDTSRQVYVLWQITGAHVPLAVGSFDVSGHGGMTIRIGKLAVPYRGTLAFAVSLENGRTIPAAPSHLVALGQVSA